MGAECRPHLRVFRSRPAGPQLLAHSRRVLLSGALRLRRGHRRLALPHRRRAGSQTRAQESSLGTIPLALPLHQQHRKVCTSPRASIVVCNGWVPASVWELLDSSWFVGNRVLGSGTFPREAWSLFMSAASMGSATPTRAAMSYLQSLSLAPCKALSQAHPWGYINSPHPAITCCAMSRADAGSGFPGKRAVQERSWRM